MPLTSAIPIDIGRTRKISLLEAKENIDPKLLQQISAALKIPVEAFENFDEEQAVNVIANTFGENASFNFGTMHVHPIDKLVEIHEQRIALYERMLKEKEDDGAIRKVDR